MQTLVDKINEQIEIFQTNANLQLTKNNKAAGTRARKAALEISICSLILSTNVCIVL